MSSYTLNTTLSHMYKNYRCRCECRKIHKNKLKLMCQHITNFISMVDKDRIYGLLIVYRYEIAYMDEIF